MKKIIILGVSLFISIAVTFSCKKNDGIISQQEKQATVQIVAVDNATIANLISLIDASVVYSFTNGTNETSIEEYFLTEAKKRGLLLLTSEELPSYSSSFREYANSIANASRFRTEKEYLTLLENTNKNVLSSTISNAEKNILVNKIAFMQAFVGYLGKKVAQTQMGMKPKPEPCDGWWDCWGKCAAGTIGGAVVGAVNSAWAGGVGCTIVLPVIGTVACGTVGAVVGAVGGGILGASQSCD